MINSMNIYIIKKDNCQSLSDYYEWIDCVYSTYESALQHLEEAGFKRKPWGKNLFYLEWVEKGKRICFNAEIIEIEVKD